MLRIQYSLLLPVIVLLQSVTFADRGDLADYYGSHVDELIDLLADQKPPVAHGMSRHAKTASDSDPEVDIDLLNRLNSEEFEQMPKITDYSDEREAAQWLKWYIRISQRYRQVRPSAVFGKLRVTFPRVGRNCSQLELRRQYHRRKSTSESRPESQAIAILTYGVADRQEIQ